MDIEIRNNKEKEKFTSVIDGYEAYLEYNQRDDKISFYRVFTPVELRGKGIAAKLVEFAFEYARENNLKVYPNCSYIISYLNRTGNYKDLLA
jgi:predicted GNAT family acetyltransferase